MLNNQLAAVATCSIAQADAFAREAWKSWASGRLSDRDVGVLQDVVDARKKAIRAFATAPSKRLSAPSPRRPIRRQRSITRRRSMATAGLLPSRLATNFTLGEMATLAVVAQAIKKQQHNQCEWPLGRVAALAGVSMTTARNALHEAHRLGLLTVTERRRNGRPSLTNQLVITSKLWLAWLRLGSRGGEGAKSFRPRSNRDNLTASAPETTPRATAKPRNRKRRRNFSGPQLVNAAVI